MVGSRAAATPIWIDGSFAWFHRGGRARGVVLCGPIGPESDYVHRIWGDLADQLCAAGLSVVRLDYLGTHDSAPCPDPSRPVGDWTGSIVAAARWLKDEAGVEHVDLVGLRFGAALAVAAAEALGGVERLVLMAPVASGAAYRRELAMLARVSREEMRLPDHVAADDGGLGLSLEALEDVGGLTLCKGGTPPARQVLAIMRPGGSTDRRLLERLGEMGVAVEEAPFAGYAALMVTPEYSQAPKADFDRVTAWLSQGLAPGAPAKAAAGPSSLALPGVTETALFFRDEAPLMGIACAPRRPSRRLPAVLFLNTGAISRGGMGGLWPGVARKLAAEGVTSLRFDVSGFGDSPARPGQLDPFVNMAEALPDVDAAIGWLQAQGHERITLIGFCWGSQLACNVAQRDPRVSGVVLVNPRRLFWDLETPPLDAILGLKGYLRLAREPARWRAVLRGAVPWRKIAAVPGQLVRRAFETGAARSLGRETPAEAAGRKLRSIAARGVDAFIVQGWEDPFLAEFEDYFNAPRSRLGELFGMDTHFPAGVDHLFRNAQVRADLAEVIVQRLKGARLAQPARLAGAA